MLKPADIARPLPLPRPNPERLLPLPAPYDMAEAQPQWKLLTPQPDTDYTPDGFTALALVPPNTPEQEKRLVDGFVSGLLKLLSADENWTFLEQLTLSLEHCTRCQTCIESCPVYVGSGRAEVYRPTYRSEVFRRLLNQHARRGGQVLSRVNGEAVELNARAICRLAELAYRCTLCRRCAQACPVGVDNALLAREIRKLFSMELGIAPKEIHDKGTMLQLRVGSSTGMNPRAVKDNIDFLDDELSELAGFRIKTPWDKPNADILLIHNAGEILSWPENVMAFALVLEAAGVNWTLSSELTGYDSVNYGVWYDDVQFARIALKQAEAARKLNVRKIVLGECGHGHKASMVIADRLLGGAAEIPRESSLVLLRDIVRSGRLRLDPARNDFPVTLHDPCNMVRMMGIVEPQREVLRAVCPRFREMSPHGVDNYCCGGGSGFAVMSGGSFPDWKLSIAGRMKLKQVLEAFADCPEPATKKYVCAPCSNCKGQFRDLFQYYGVSEKSGIFYGGLVELVANALVDLKKPLIQWESH